MTHLSRRRRAGRGNDDLPLASWPPSISKDTSSQPKGGGHGMAASV